MGQTLCTIGATTADDNLIQSRTCSVSDFLKEYDKAIPAVIP